MRIRDRHPDPALPPDDKEWIAPTVVAPPEVTATIDLGGDYDTDDDGEPRCTVYLTAKYDGEQYAVERLTVERAADGPPVDSELLRHVGVAEVLPHVVAPTMKRAERDGGRVTIRLGSLVPESFDASQGPTDEALRVTASLYAASAAVGLAPLQAVVDVLGLTRSTAGRWVRKARDAGLLDPATPGRRGTRAPAAG